MTVTSSRLTRLSLSIIRLARSSVIIPVMALKLITAKKTRLLQAWTETKATAITKLRALKRVKTFRLTICQLLVLVSFVKSLVKPCEIFSSTWVWFKPINSFLFMRLMIPFFYGNGYQNQLLQPKFGKILQTIRV